MTTTATIVYTRSCRVTQQSSHLSPDLTSRAPLRHDTDSSGPAGISCARNPRVSALQTTQAARATTQRACSANPPGGLSAFSLTHHHSLPRSKKQEHTASLLLSVSVTWPPHVADRLVQRPHPFLRHRPPRAMGFASPAPPASSFLVHILHPLPPLLLCLS